MNAPAPGPSAGPAVLVMAKAPWPGRAKTRLRPLLGPQRCAALQEALITHTTELACGQFALDPGLWSGEKVLAATLALAGGHQLRSALLPPLRDLDTPEDTAALLLDPQLPARIATVLSPEHDRPGQPRRAGAK